MTIDDTIAEVLRLDAEATPFEDWILGGDDDLMIQNRDRSIVAEASWCSPRARQDASLIALYRTAAPELAREVQRLNDEVRMWKSESCQSDEQHAYWLRRAVSAEGRLEHVEARLMQLECDQDELDAWRQVCLDHGIAPDAGSLRVHLEVLIQEEEKKSWEDHTK